MVSDNNLRQVLFEILKRYPSPTQIGGDKPYTTVNTDEELQELVKHTSKEATQQVLEDRDEKFHIWPSLGQGNMSDIPYIPIELPRETKSTRKGIYVVYLFDSEADELYLTLNQGATEAKRAASLNGPDATTILSRHAELYRSLINWPETFDGKPAGLTETISEDGGQTVVNYAEEYNAGAVLTRSYSLRDLGSDGGSNVVDDLHALLDVYEELLETLYSKPEFADVDQVWKISPDGGKDPYWSTWVDEDIASIGYTESGEFGSEGITSKPDSPHNSPKQQVYAMQKEIEEGDIIVAGAPQKNIDVGFGVGRVTADYADTMEAVKERDTIGPSDFDHKTLISVDWYTFPEPGIAINCWKDAGKKKLFHNWTLETFDAQFDHFIGAIARRAAVQGLTEDEETLIDDTVTHLGLTRTDGGQTGDDGGGEDTPEDEFDSYGDWKCNHDDAIKTATKPKLPAELVFPEEKGEEILSRIASAFENDKHVILTGPPGTGKTKLARHVADHYVGDAHQMVTATADWSTFDTIGGYRPKTDRELQFHSGVFLDRFQSNDAGTPQTEWLIIDELNRADIDKAFGSLLSALTDETIQLPFEADGQPITVIGDPVDGDPIAPHRYHIPADWRLMGTMNTYDKTSLYQLSYAFMRRFAFIPVSVPDAKDVDADLIQEYTEQWFGPDALDQTVAADVADLWRRINSVRSIGPAIVRDIVGDINGHTRVDFTDPLIMYVMPQLEGLPKADQREFVATLQEFRSESGEGVSVDIGALEDFVFDYFGVEVDVSEL